MHLHAAVVVEQLESPVRTAVVADVRLQLLQQPGRLSGAAPTGEGSAGAAVQVRRLDGSTVQTVAVNGATWTSKALAPGNYRVTVVPRSPYVPQTVDAVVTAATTTRVALPAPVLGATVRGQVRADGQSAGAGSVADSGSGAGQRS